MIKIAIIKKLPNGKYRLYSRKKDKSGKRRNLGTYDSLAGAKKREKAVQWFKHHSDDGMADDFQTKTLSRLSNIATYLEEAGFIDAADKVYMTMDAIDGDLKEDNVVDMFVNTDEQMNVGGGKGFSQMHPGHGGPSISMDAAEIVAKLVNMANQLDKFGMHDDADLLDDVINDISEDEEQLLEIIKELESTHKTKEKEKVETQEPDKQGEEAVARSTGHVGSGMIDNQGCGMGQGLSDMYFYRGTGSIEDNL